MFPRIQEDFEMGIVRGRREKKDGDQILPQRGITNTQTINIRLGETGTMRSTEREVKRKTRLSIRPNGS